MKIIKKNQVNRFENDKNCTAVEYPLGDKDINGAVIELRGRYPEKGIVMNTVCKEIAYIIDGSGIIVIEEEEFQFEKGDMFLLEANENIIGMARRKFLHHARRPGHKISMSL